MPSAFSMPPMRCSRPGVPGMAHGRASVSGSRLNGRNSPSVAVRAGRRTPGEMSGSSATLGQPPRLRAVGQVAVGQQHDRRAVLHRDPGRLDGRVEAVATACTAPRPAPATRRCGRTGPCSRSVCSVLVGMPVRRPGPLHVDDDQRQLGGDGQADGLGLQRHAGAGGGGDAERPAERRAQRRADARDLVLGLEGADAEPLVLGQLVQDVARPG